MKKTITYLLSGILFGFILLFNSFCAISQPFSGEIDVTIRTHDGVKTVMKIVERKVQEPLENLLVNSTFTWIDNGRNLGTITFTTDRIAHPSWSNRHHTWRLEANNNLIVSGNGTQYVARLKWNSNSQSFSGERDVTSQVQDGVKTVMKMVDRKVVRNVDRKVQEPLENLLVNSTFTWIDNGRTLGTITFTSDRIAHPSWSNNQHTWRLEANNNLLVSGNGTQYVVRLKWNSNSQSFSGGRDATSRTQDGVKTVMKIVERKVDIKVQAPLENLLVNSTFTWIDNGRTLGTIIFTTNRIAHPSWSNNLHTWRLEANNNLLVSGNGTQYVVRLKWNSNSQSFSGGRDATSRTQDGVKTVMKIVERSGNSSGMTTTPAPVSSQPVVGGEIFNNENKVGVFNGAKSNTYFYVGQTTTISSILNYHWNRGNGSQPGQIGLRDASGLILGTWQSEGSDGMRGVKNANWTVYPNITLQPGIYLITDSEPSTWSQNSGSYGAGFSIVNAK